MFKLLPGAKVYISGPIRGIENGNRGAFDYAQEFLNEKGFVGVNPHEINERMHPSRRQVYSECLRDDFEELVRCDAIYMLQGWHFSTGANKEIQMAITMELPVWFEQRNDQIHE